MNFAAVTVTVESASGLDWNSVLSAVLGGLFALAGVVVSQRWAQRNQREARVSELVEATRAGALLEGLPGRSLRRLELSEGDIAFTRDLMSLRGLCFTLKKRGSRSLRGFAATIIALTDAIFDTGSAGAPGNTAPSDDRQYELALEAFVLACLMWERNPQKFREGDQSAAMLALAAKDV